MEIDKSSRYGTGITVTSSSNDDYHQLDANELEQDILRKEVVSDTGKLRNSKFSRYGGNPAETIKAKQIDIFYSIIS